jgi:hypothetical protein
MPAIIPTAPATHPKRDPVFTSCTSETEANQILRVAVDWGDGTRDAVEEIMGDAGAWLPSEVVAEAEERLQRALHRRRKTL